MKPTLERAVRTGDLRQRVIYKGAVYNSPGDEIISWGTFATVWAAVEPTDIQSDEDFQSDKQTAVQYVIVRHRYIAGINTKMKLFHGSVEYDVRAIADVESRKRQHYVTCRLVQ